MTPGRSTTRKSSLRKLAPAHSTLTRSDATSVTTLLMGKLLVHTNFVTPGTAIGGSGSFTSQSYRGGDRSSFEFRALSQVISWPVYAAMRPRIAMRVDFAM